MKCRCIDLADVYEIGMLLSWSITFYTSVEVGRKSKHRNHWDQILSCLHLSYYFQFKQVTCLCYPMASFHIYKQEIIMPTLLYEHFNSVYFRSVFKTRLLSCHYFNYYYYYQSCQFYTLFNNGTQLFRYYCYSKMNC